MKALAALLSLILLMLLPACSEQPAADPPEQDHSHDEAQAAPSNRIDIPPAVRQNLGITFATVERRPVARTLRMPGRFELLPAARREYHAPLGGRVELLVEQYQQVEEGTPLYRLDAPGWRELQRQIADAQGAMRRAQAEQESAAPLLEAHASHRESLEASVNLWTTRVEQLEQIRAAGGGKADEWAQAQASLAQARADLAGVIEQTAELEARRAQARAELDAAAARLDLLLASASTLLGMPHDRLAAEEPGAAPLWRTTSTVEVRAAAPGVVESVPATNGAWVDETSPVLTTIQPSLVRFRARGLQSDLGRLRDGLPARVVPPQGGTLSPAEAMEGTLAVGLVADPDERTVDLMMTPATPAPWARPGVSGFLEVVVEGTGGPELSIPLSAVIRDGLTPVIFRRDPKDPDKAIRLQADLGIDDGRHVEVRSGLREGDQVVLDGVYQLMLASSGSAAEGGHFHSDGTFHEGEDE